MDLQSKKFSDSNVLGVGLKKQLVGRFLYFISIAASHDFAG